MTRIVPSRPNGAVPRRLAGLLPGRRRTADHAGLLDRLAPVEHRPAADEEQLFEQASLARVLLLMVKVDQEAEYLLCRELAEHALGSVPEPRDGTEASD
ncbi:hypothetical protein OG883_09315 [Streptomyces sp. NBC_01142]|uniref:hypothetical protein n=1 Tax=Streptomyces sp. NBC_01142 TaxID=2975865 RepID=UPI00225BD15D|nr:hypothetical protein [Streptomyces sp. NBC_01142]MCX4820100.1 hypothetical protein [Streptomyces sp. NBC_01142]